MTLLEKLMPKSDDFFSDFEAQWPPAGSRGEAPEGLLDDFTDCTPKVQAIKDVEDRADDITYRAFARLHTQFITPFDRAEIHHCSPGSTTCSTRDAAAERLGLYDIDQVLPDARDLASVLVAQAEKMREAVGGLKDMKKNPHVILEACKEIVLENQADTLLPPHDGEALQARNDPLTVPEVEGDRRPHRDRHRSRRGRRERARGRRPGTRSEPDPTGCRAVAHASTPCSSPSSSS